MAHMHNRSEGRGLGLRVRSRAPVARHIASARQDGIRAARAGVRNG